jgi:hypothetical protein
MTIFKNSKQFAAPLLVAALMAGAVAAGLLAEGCSSTAQSNSFKAATATDAAVRAAMIGWGAYVTVAKPGTNSETQVRNAFDIYRSAELAVIDATSAVSTNATATNALNAALIAEAAAQADLVNLVSSLTNTTTK